MKFRQKDGYWQIAEKLRIILSFIKGQTCIKEGDDEILLKSVKCFLNYMYLSIIYFLYFNFLEKSTVLISLFKLDFIYQIRLNFHIY